jgi:hypothetical protein
MHTTSYGNLECVVGALVHSIDVYTSNVSVNILSMQQENEEDDANTSINNSSLNHLPLLNIDYTQITPKLYHQIYSNTNVILIRHHDIDTLYKLLYRTILRIKVKNNDDDITNNNDNDNNNKVQNIFILDGMLASICNLFSRFVDEKKINYNLLNFRKVYMLLIKIQELDKLIGYKVQLNESNEIWDIIDKIFIPCNDKCDYTLLVEYLSTDLHSEGSDKILGSDSFVNLTNLLQKFGIRKKIC